MSTVVVEFDRAKERRILKDWFETTHFDEESKGVPADPDPNADDETKSDDFELESKVRHVRTPAGQRRFGQPIGSIIVRDHVLANLTIGKPEFTGWDRVTDKRGNKYDVGKRDGKWIATPAGEWGEIVSGNSADEVFTALDKHAGGGKKPTAVPTVAVRRREPNTASVPKAGGKNYTREEHDDPNYEKYTGADGKTYWAVQDEASKEWVLLDDSDKELFASKSKPSLLKNLNDRAAAVSEPKPRSSMRRARDLGDAQDTSRATPKPAVTAPAPTPKPPAPKKPSVLAPKPSVAQRAASMAKKPVVKKPSVPKAGVRSNDGIPGPQDEPKETVKLKPHQMRVGMRIKVRAWHDDVPAGERDKPHWYTIGMVGRESRMGMWSGQRASTAGMYHFLDSRGKDIGSGSPNQHYTVDASTVNGTEDDRVTIGRLQGSRVTVPLPSPRAKRELGMPEPKTAGYYKEIAMDDPNYGYPAIAQAFQDRIDKSEHHSGKVDLMIEKSKYMLDKQEAVRELTDVMHGSSYAIDIEKLQNRIRVLQPDGLLLSIEQSKPTAARKPPKVTRKKPELPSGTPAVNPADVIAAQRTAERFNLGNPNSEMATAAERRINAPNHAALRPEDAFTKLRNAETMYGTDERERTKTVSAEFTRLRQQAWGALDPRQLVMTLANELTAHHPSTTKPSVAWHGTEAPRVDILRSLATQYEEGTINRTDLSSAVLSMAINAHNMPWGRLLSDFGRMIAKAPVKKSYDGLNLEVKSFIESKVRYVRTPEGSARYGRPIGTIIGGNGRDFHNLSIGENHTIRGKDGYDYTVRRAGNRWEARTPEISAPVVHGASQDEVLAELDKYVASNPKNPKTGPAVGRAKVPQPKTGAVAPNTRQRRQQIRQGLEKEPTQKLRQAAQRNGINAQGASREGLIAKLLKFLIRKLLGKDKPLPQRQPAMTGKAALQQELKDLILDLEEKIRHVRTAAGAARYNLPIGSPIPEGPSLHGSRVPSMDLDAGKPLEGGVKPKRYVISPHMREQRDGLRRLQKRVAKDRPQMAEDLNDLIGRVVSGGITDEDTLINVLASMFSPDEVAYLFTRMKNIGLDSELKSMVPALDMKADKQEHTGAMVALVPSDRDVIRLVAEGGEDADELHVTLAYLGEAADISENARFGVIQQVALVAGRSSQPGAAGFAVNIFNPEGDDPCVVIGVNGIGHGLSDLHAQTTMGLTDVEANNNWRMPDQHTPWIPHITLKYFKDEPVDMDWVKEQFPKLGPIQFDRIRVAFGGNTIDFPLTEATMPASAEGKAMPTSGKCDYCAGKGTKRIVYAEGRGVIFTCDKHLDKGKQAAGKATPDGKYDEENIDSISSVKSMRDMPATEKCKFGPEQATMRLVWEGRAYIATCDVHKIEAREELRENGTRPIWVYDMEGNKTGEMKAVVITPGGRIGDDSSHNISPRHNWVEDRGGLPKYIRTIRNGIMREQGKDEDSATALAIAAVKRWASGRGKVSPKVRAAAAKAVAQWEAMKATKADDAAVAPAGNHIQSRMAEGSALVGDIQRGNSNDPRFNDKHPRGFGGKFGNKPGNGTGKRDSASSLTNALKKRLPMEYGQQGPVIEQVQVLLGKVGFQTEQDGIFGDKTVAAVKAAQKKFGMQPTGKVDEALMTALLEHARPSSSRSKR